MLQRWYDPQRSSMAGIRCSVLNKRRRIADIATASEEEPFSPVNCCGSRWCPTNTRFAFRIYLVINIMWVHDIGPMKATGHIRICARLGSLMVSSDKLKNQLIEGPFIVPMFVYRHYALSKKTPRTELTLLFLSNVLNKYLQ